MQLADLTGVRFGKLLVLSRVGYNADRRITWLCRCDCGVEIIKVGKMLKKAKELYCGDMHPTKICTSCKKDKNKETEYHKANNKLGTINPKCKECISQWYIENKDVIKENYLMVRKDEKRVQTMRETSRKSRNKHIEKEKAYKKVYDQREDVKERKRQIHHKRKVVDMNYNIKRRLRWRIRDVFKDLGMDGKKYKYKSSIVLLGCDMEFFKSYIESKFIDGMCWERISEIHIDHIIPCSQFDLTKIEDQIRCSNYKNLQPLWWVDNLTKGSKYTPTSTDS